MHVLLSATLLWIQHFENLHPVTAFGKGPPLPPHVMPLDPEIVAVSMMIERDLGDFGHNEGEGQTMSVI
jgi:hypothetical protein